MRRNLNEKYGYYECNHILHIPQCMIQGSLNNALKISNCNDCKEGERIVEYLMQQQMYGIKDHVQQKEDDDECTRKKEDVEM